MRADNTRHIIAAARQRHELTRAKAIQALRTLDADGRPISFWRRRSGSRDIPILALRPTRPARRDRPTPRHASPGPASLVSASQRASNASLLRRLETAQQRIRQLTEENR
jgi:hypothetical protein